MKHKTLDTIDIFAILGSIFFTMFFYGWLFVSIMAAVENLLMGLCSIIPCTIWCVFFTVITVRIIVGYLK